MANLPDLENQIRAYRLRQGWSQDELARRAGLSRAGISAIEMGRLVPSAAAALALASAFACHVEDLFHLPRTRDAAPLWAWPPRREPCRYWRADVSGRTLLYPVEATPMGTVPHDGIFRNHAVEDHGRADPARTLVLACCDPAVGLLAGELARSADVRLIVVPRSSTAALSLLGQGLVHLAGVHLGRAGASEGNAAVVRSQLGKGFRLLHVARWDEGIAFTPGRRNATVRDALRANLRWVGREVGSGARQCLDELLGASRPPRRLAHDHRGVAESIRSGWADVGVCLRLTSEEAGLEFLGVRQEAYDLCFPETLRGDRRLQALIDTVRSSTYRRILGEQPGYDTAESGGLRRVT
jgi:molybdate-binding protein/DNA-binding XRE family transcriptional regulator